MGASPTSAPATIQWIGLLQRIALPLAVGLVTLILGAIAVSTHDPTTPAWRIAVDVAVGLAFVVVAVASPGRMQMRALMVTVGWAWLLASVPAVPGLWHQTILAISLLLFPSGRSSKPMQWALIAMAVPFAVGFSSQPLMALYFFAVGSTVIATRDVLPSLVWFPGLSSLAISLVLAGLWLTARFDPNDFNPRTGLLVYQLVLIAVAIGYAFASRAAARLASQFTDTLLGEGEPTGIDAFRAVLAGTLHDETLQIQLHDEGTRREEPSRRLQTKGRQSEFDVTDSGHHLATVHYSTSSLDDEHVRESVATALRMTLINEHLIAELELQAQMLKAARARLMTAVDEVRADTGARLRGDVLVPLDRAIELLRNAVSKVGGDDVGDALSIALSELRAANSDIMSLSVGVRPPDLGQKGLVRAIGDLAARSPIPVTTSLPEDLQPVDAEVETTLYYVASEAITNAVKHADASRIEVSLAQQGDHLLLSVRDNGRGNADPTGSGLLGLADRLAARGGRLGVESSTRAGTAITAVILNRSSATA